MTNTPPFVNAVESRQAWIVVCTSCLRTRHNGQWTDVQALDIHGRDTDRCDDCAPAPGTGGRSAS
jgi:hypothetical protein